MHPNGHEFHSSLTEREICQLQGAPEATIPFRKDELLVMAADKQARRIMRIVRKVAADPSIVVRKLHERWTIRHPRTECPAGSAERSDTAPPRVVPRHLPPLAAGERVRVRSIEEIKRTLDANGACGGMGFLPIVMERYCGGTYTVRSRVERFFDERRWKMLKLRDAVILDGVFCEPPRTAGVDWAGCNRSCFVFWKECWLERVGSADAPSE